MSPSKDVQEIPVPRDDGPKQSGDGAWIENVDITDKTSHVMDKFRSYTPDFAKETERKLVRRIDRRLLPLVVVIYLFNYLDRNSITQARLYGLEEDTHVKAATSQTAISIFSAGYIAMQLPSTILMTRLRPSLFLVRNDSLALH